MNPRSKLRRAATRWAVAMALVLGAGVSNRAEAGGYFSGTKGARAAGRSGAFAAKADDLTALSFNPAGLARIGTTVIHVGNRFSHNAYAFTRAPTLDWGNLQGGAPPYVTFSRVSNELPWQLLDPLIGVASNFGLENWGFGLSIASPAGVARQEFPVDGGQRYMMVRREALILYYTLGAAWKYRDKVGIGASLRWIHVPRLDYEVVVDADPLGGDFSPVSSELDMLARTSGSDPFAFNAILGMWIRPIRAFELALSGQIIPAKIETRSTLELDPLTETIDDEVILTREGEPADDVSLSLPLPLSATLGLRYRHFQGERERFDLELDLTYESWGMVDRFELDSRGLSAELVGTRLEIGKILIQKHWRPTFLVALGSDVPVIPERLVLRAGAAYESAVAPPAYANVDFVGGHQLGGSLGFSVLVKGFEIAVAYEGRGQLPVRVLESDARVYQQVPGSACLPPYTDANACSERYPGQPAPAVNAGTYRAHNHAVSLDLLYRFGPRRAKRTPKRGSAPSAE